MGPYLIRRRQAEARQVVNMEKQKALLELLEQPLLQLEAGSQLTSLFLHWN